MMKKINTTIKYKEVDFNLIGIVSIAKEYKIGWILNNLLDISLVKNKDEKINLSNGNIIRISHLIYRKDKKYIRLISNRLDRRFGKMYLISSLSNFDYLIQYSNNFFDFESLNIINTLKTNNFIQFANFVDTNIINEKYLLYQ